MYKEREILFNNRRTDWSKIQELVVTTILSYVDWINSNLKDRYWEEITKKTVSNTLNMKALRCRIY